MQWNTYLVFPDGTPSFNRNETHWKQRPIPKLLAKIGSFKDIKGATIRFSKYFDLTNHPNLGKLLAGSISSQTTESSYNSMVTQKSVESINVLLDVLKEGKVGMDIHRLNAGTSRVYTAAAISYFDTAYSYDKRIAVYQSGGYWTPNAVDREGLIRVGIGSLPNLSDFGYSNMNIDDKDLAIFGELQNLDIFTSEHFSDYYEYLTLEDDLIPTEVKPMTLSQGITQVISKVDDSTELLEKLDGAISNLDVSNFDTSDLSELITECKNGIEESLRKSTEQSSELDSIIGALENINTSIENIKLEDTLSSSLNGFSAKLDTISEFYGTRIFEIDELKAELSSFYDKAIAAWKESIESISESLTASAQAGSVALDINQALDSLKSNLKRVETLASIFDKASTVSGEISTNAQIVGTSVSTLSSLLLSFNESVNGYEKTLLSLVENVRQNLDLFLHSSDSMFRQAQKAVSDSVVTNAISKSIDVISSLKKKETL